jgi:phospholipid/cholesterol/gamma-HCH transport system substrate-binding protein
MNHKLRIGAALALILALCAATVAVYGFWGRPIGKTRLTAYFDNSNGIFVGDEIRILGVPVGAIDAIEPQPQRAKISFWVDSTYKVPAEAKAVILAPQLVTARAIQLTPAYVSGPAMRSGDVIPQPRTAVPVEWDDLRRQLEKLTDSLQPTQPGGVSSLGAFINTTADNERGQGTSIRDTILKMSQAFSALGDHSTDIFSTVKNLSILVAALQSSTDLMAQLNRNLAAVSAALADDPDEVGQAVADLNSAVGNVRSFVAENREALATSSNRLTSVSTALVASLDDIKQALHLIPDAAQNLANIYQPAQATLTSVLAMNNFSNPIEFLCGAIQAASRMDAEQSSKLCVQYLAPIIKNRQYNFLPLAQNLLVGAMARPNEITYSQDWMRPDHVPASSPPPGDVVPPTASLAVPSPAPPLPAEEPTPQPTNPGDGLSGLMVPQGPKP